MRSASRSGKDLGPYHPDCESFRKLVHRFNWELISLFLGFEDADRVPAIIDFY